MVQNRNFVAKNYGHGNFFYGPKYKNNPLSKILDIKKLMNVDKAIESANGLPNECYTSEQYLEYERDKIFCDKWTVIGVASSIPNVGMPYHTIYSGFL
jgi:choline monooxygenase